MPYKWGDPKYLPIPGMILHVRRRQYRKCMEMHLFGGEGFHPPKAPKDSGTLKLKLEITYISSTLIRLKGIPTTYTKALYNPKV